MPTAANAARGTRMLYLDDSGAISPKHSSGAVEIGLVVMDRSENRLDAHASHCVASYVTSKDLPLHPVVHYVDSMTSEPTQAADLISAVRRRTIEGTPGMHVLNTQLASLRAKGLTAKRTHTNRPWTNQIIVI